MAIEHTPSRNEEEYFARIDAALRKEMRANVDVERGGVATNLLNIFN
jgi:hypothetical protein